MTKAEVIREIRGYTNLKPGNIRIAPLIAQGAPIQVTLLSPENLKADGALRGDGEANLRPEDGLRLFNGHQSLFNFPWSDNER